MTQDTSKPVTQASLDTLFKEGGPLDLISARLAGAAAAGAAVAPSGAAAAAALLREELIDEATLRRFLERLGYQGESVNRRILAAGWDRTRERRTLMLQIRQAEYRFFKGVSPQLLYAQLLAHGYAPERAMLYATLSYTRGKSPSAADGLPALDLPTPEEAAKLLTLDFGELDSP